MKKRLCILLLVMQSLNYCSERSTPAKDAKTKLWAEILNGKDDLMDQVNKLEDKIVFLTEYTSKSKTRSLGKYILRIHKSLDDFSAACQNFNLNKKDNESSSDED